MNNEQRSIQIWSILVMAATNKQILTYEIIKALTGLHLPAIGRALFPIQYYCESKSLPRLTVLVVRKNTGMPGDGLPIGPEEILSEIQTVYMPATGSESARPKN